MVWRNVVPIWLSIAALSCAPRTVPPPGQIHRIAVLPPQGLPNGPGKAGTVDAPALALGDVVADAARQLLAQKGYDVVDPMQVAAAADGHAPASPRMAAEMVADAHLDAAAMFISVPIWQPSHEGMRTDSVIVAMDVMLVDPHTGEVMWRVHRSAKPVPLYGTLFIGQADVFAAETVMREVLAGF